MSSLFDLNDRIFAAMDELDAADEEHIEQAIEKARTKTQLFAMAINSANTIAKVASMQEQTMDGLALKIGTSRVLLGQPQVVAEVENQPVLPEFDAIAWVKSNAHGHTVSWIRDRLNRASGADYSFEEVRAICDEARVEPVELGEKMTMQQAESDGYGLHGPAKGYAR
jgi:hypothetical protein